MKTASVSVEDAEDWIKWKSRTRMVNHKQLEERTGEKKNTIQVYDIDPILAGRTYMLSPATE